MADLPARPAIRRPEPAAQRGGGLQSEAMELPAEPRMRWVLRRSATLLGFGAEPVRGLVQPTGEFLPDAFDGSPRAVTALLARVQDHAGLSDLKTELAVVKPDEDEQPTAGGCSSGACGGAGKLGARIDRLARRDDGSYVVAIAAGEVRHPTVLTTALVRSVASMFMTECGGYDDLPRSEHEPATDLAAVLLGFGVLLSNGSYIYMKGCGSVSVHCATKMPVDEMTLALAVYCTLHALPERLAGKHLETTPRASFEEAMLWAGSNAGVIRLLRRDPEVVEADDFQLSPPGSWLSRLFRGKRRVTTTATSDDLAELERSLSESADKSRAVRRADPARARRLAEIKDLVDDSLDAAEAAREQRRRGGTESLEG